jgi:hypothetical protein
VEIEMKHFYCPYCNEELTVLSGSAFKLKGILRSDFFECSSFFYLTSTPGHFGLLIDDHLKLKEGARVNFCCPNDRCGESFTTNYDQDLSQIKMVDDNNDENVVVFNRIYGKHATFVVDYQKKSLRASYGEDKLEYIHDFDSEIDFIW